MPMPHFHTVWKVEKVHSRLGTLPLWCLGPRPRLTVHWQPPLSCTVLKKLTRPPPHLPTSPTLHSEQDHALPALMTQTELPPSLSIPAALANCWLPCWHLSHRTLGSFLLLTQGQRQCPLAMGKWTAVQVQLTQLRRHQTSCWHTLVTLPYAQMGAGCPQTRRKRT